MNTSPRLNGKKISLIAQTLRVVYTPLDTCPLVQLSIFRLPHDTAMMSSMCVVQHGESVSRFISQRVASFVDAVTTTFLSKRRESSSIVRCIYSRFSSLSGSSRQKSVSGMKVSPARCFQTGCRRHRSFLAASARVSHRNAAARRTDSFARIPVPFECACAQAFPVCGRLSPRFP